VTQEQKTQLAWVWLHGECWPSAQIHVEVPVDFSNDQIEQVLNQVADQVPKCEFQHFPNHVFDVRVSEIRVLDREGNIDCQQSYTIRRNDKGAWELVRDY
jgi:hypothetical protein